MSTTRNLLRYTLTVLITAVTVFAATYYAVERRIADQLTTTEQFQEKLTKDLEAARDSLKLLQTESAFEWHGGPICLYFLNRFITAGAYEGGRCDAGVYPVERMLPATRTPVQDAIRMLWKGELTDEEREAGFTTEFPIPDVTISQATIEDGVLTLVFDDPKYRTSGGSCRVIPMTTQIEKTALQFPWMREVRLGEHFQP